MAAPDYDVMAEEEEPATEEDVELESSDPADDDEFMMHAEEAGFTGEKAKALWRAVARCAELTASAPMPMEDDLLEDL